MQIERIRDLHSEGYVHNDIKLENILIGYKDPAKIYLIDFGLSQPYLSEETISGMCDGMGDGQINTVMPRRHLQK